MGTAAIRFAILLAALVAAWQPPKAHAHDDDTQLWLLGAVRGNLSDDLFLTVDTSYRWREERIGGEQQHIRLALDKRLASNMTIGGGMAHFSATAKQEIRPHQQIRLAGRGFEARTRLEQRFFDDADRMELRLRQRVQYSFGLRGNIGAVVSGEWLKLLRARERGLPPGTQELRALAGIVVPLGKGFDISPNYLVILTPRPDLSDRVSHVAQIWISYQF